jgi:hypothetical protein
MSLIILLLLLPFSLISLRVGKEEVKVLVQGGLILLGYEHIVSPKPDDIRTQLPLGVHGISSHDAVFDQRWTQPRQQGADLIAFVLDCSMS